MAHETVAVGFPLFFLAVTDGDDRFEVPPASLIETRFKFVESFWYIMEIENYLCIHLE